MRKKARMTVLFPLVLLSVVVVWGALYFSFPKGAQRMIFSNDAETYFTDYLVPREFVAPADEMYCPAPNVWTHGNASPLPALEILRPFSADRGGAVKFMLCSALFFCSMLFLFFTKVKMNLGVSVIMLMALGSSWIFMRTIERGNCIFIAAGLCLLFLSWFESKRPLLRVLAAIALGVATSIKISPAFLGLFYFAEPIRSDQGVRNYDWLSMFVSGFVAVLLLLLPFFFGGDFSGDFSAWMANVGREASGHMSTWGFHGIVRYGSGVISRFAPWIDVGVCKWITVFAGMILLVAFFGMVTVRGVATKSDRLFVVVAAMLVLCTNSMFYLGLLLFPSLVMWLRELDESKTVSLWEYCQMALWLFMLMPLQIVFDGKTATMFITFFSFWALIVSKLVVCGRRFCLLQQSAACLVTKEQHGRNDEA